MSNREVTFTMAQVQRYETIQAAIEQRMTAGEAAQGVKHCTVRSWRRVTR
jgi:hypothetical protein